MERDMRQRENATDSERETHVGGQRRCETNTGCRGETHRVQG